MSTTEAHSLDFTEVISRLALWRDETLSQLRNPETHATTLALKRQLDAAIAHLEFCQRFQIKPSEQVTVLPDLRTMTPSCAYRIMEDNETDQREQWIELEIGGGHLELSPGDIIIPQSYFFHLGTCAM